MRIAPWFMAGFVLALASGAGAQTTGSAPAHRARAPFDYQQWLRDAKFKSRIFERAEEIRPARRDTPMRELNISDNEVREIQVVAEQFLPRALVNISTVVSDCPCEEGPQCTDQVFILANRSATTLGLQMSRVKNAWTVGAVQRWWLEYEALQKREPDMEWREYEDALTQLAKKFPQCVGQLVPAQNTAANPQPTEKK
jgi:hypothetical protein